MVEIEQSAETLSPPNVGDQAHWRWRSLQELVVESLMVSLAVVVLDVLAHEETQVPLAERDDIDTSKVMFWDCRSNQQIQLTPVSSTSHRLRFCGTATGDPRERPEYGPP